MLVQSGFKILPNTACRAQCPLPEVLPAIHAEQYTLRKSPQILVPSVRLMLVPAQPWPLCTFLPSPKTPPSFLGLFSPLDNSSEQLQHSEAAKGGDFSAPQTLEGLINRTAALWLWLAAVLALCETHPIHVFYYSNENLFICFFFLRLRLPNSTWIVKAVQLPFRLPSMSLLAHK